VSPCSSSVAKRLAMEAVTGTSTTSLTERSATSTGTSTTSYTERSAELDGRLTGSSTTSLPSVTVVNVAERDREQQPLTEAFARPVGSAPSFNGRLTGTSTTSLPSVIVVNAAERDLEEQPLTEASARPVGPAPSTPARHWEVTGTLYCLVDNSPRTPLRQAPRSPVQYTPSLGESSSPPSTLYRIRSPPSHHSSDSATTLERGEDSV